MQHISGIKDHKNDMIIALIKREIILQESKDVSGGWKEGGRKKLLRLRFNDIIAIGCCPFMKIIKIFILEQNNGLPFYYSLRLLIQNLMETKRHQCLGLLKVSKTDPTFYFYSASGVFINIDASNKHKQASTGVLLAVFQW